MATHRRTTASWILAALACAGCGAGCGAGRMANSDVPRVQQVVAGEVTLVLGVEPAPRSTLAPGRPPAALLAAPLGDRPPYDYEFHEDPLAAGASMEPGFKNPGYKPCPPWSTCEVKSVLELHKELFRGCLPGGDAAPGAAIRFVARAVIDQDGRVREADVGGVDPPAAGAAACAERALEQIPFPLETYEVTVALTVPIRVVTAAR